MRILIAAPVSRELGGVDTGGIVTHAWGLATTLASRGHEVAIVADNRPAELGITVQDGVRVYGLRGYPLGTKALAYADPRMLVAVVRTARRLGPGWGRAWLARSVLGYRFAIQDFKPDVVHVHTLEARFALVQETSFGRVPIVATAHSTHYVEYAEDDARDDRRALVERNLADARDVIFVSEWVAERHERVFPHKLDHARKVVLPNPIDAREYRPVARQAARARIGVAPEEPMLLTVANLVPRKDPATLVRAVAHLRGQGMPVRAIWVGQGPEAAATHRLIAESGLDGIVRLEGHVPQESMNDYYSAADLFVFPSLMETWGLAAVEAMLCGCPVVGTFEVMTEVVPDFAGIYVPSHAPEDLAKAIRSALARSWDREAIRRFALGYDWQQRIGGFEAVYERAVSRS